MNSILTEKKALALAGGRFLSTSTSEHLHQDVLSLGYLYNSTKSQEYQKQFYTVDKVDAGATGQETGRYLGNTTNYVSSFKKYDVLNYVKQIVAGHEFRVSSCMKQVSKEVQVVRTGNSYHFHGIMSCGSVWMCPVCASRISEARRKELNKALQFSRLYPVLVTATLSHQRGDKLAGLVQVLNSSLRNLKAGSWWGKFKEKYGVRAYASSLEVTYSFEAGFHPHKHILFFIDSGEINFDEFRAELSERYSKLVKKAGGYSHLVHGLDVKAGTEHAGNYISKWGAVEEVTKSNLKEAGAGSYSIWELAELGAGGCSWAREAFLEYAYVTYGRRAITYSHGARDILGLGTEINDAEIVETEVLAVISREAWKRVLLYGLQASILSVAKYGGAELLWQFIQKIEGYNTS